MFKDQYLENYRALTQNLSEHRIYMHTCWALRRTFRHVKNGMIKQIIS